MTPEDYSALGYNIDFSNGYNRSNRPSTERSDFLAAHPEYSGSKWDVSKGWNDYQVNLFNEWRDSTNNIWDAYANWYDKNFELDYNSEANRLARLRAIGQNPYYTEQLGNQASLQGSPAANMHPGEDNKYQGLNQGLSVFSELAQGALTFIGQISEIAKLQDNNALTQQKTIKQALDNRWQAHQMGIDLPAEPGSLLPNLGQLSDEVLGIQGTSAGYQWNKTKYGPQHGKIFDKSYQGYMSQYILSGVHANEQTANYKLDNVLPHIQTIYENEAVLSGISREQAEKINGIYDKYVELVEGGYDFEISKVKQDLSWLKADKWIDAASKLIGAGVQLHSVIAPHVNRGQLPNLNLGGFTYGNSSY